MTEIDGNDKVAHLPVEPLQEAGAPEKPVNDEAIAETHGRSTGATTDDPTFTPSIEEKPRKLCGYLYKLGLKAPLKSWKCRFFSYDEKCHLLYYRTATDVCPLGSIDLHVATFHFSMEAEEGIFEIKTPTKPYILKAINNHAKMYWLQQLQRKRWEYCNNASKIHTGFILPSDVTDDHYSADGDFLPPVKTPTEVVGSNVASMPAPQESTSLQNISLKHPWKEIQNTVRNICGSKPLQTRSIFHLQEAEQATEGEVSAKQSGKMSPSLNFARKARKQNGCLASNPEKNSQEKVNNSQLQIQVVTEELKSQKDLVKLLHRALESAQEEKRACTEYRSAPEEEDRLELIRHKVRQIVDLRQRAEVLEQDKLELEQCIGLKDFHIGELKGHVQLLMEKNSAKQQVITKQNEQLLSQIDSDNASSAGMETLQRQWRKIDSLMDDINAYKTQNQFLNSEIHQVTQLWRNTAEKETALLMKCSYLEARNCQIEIKYLLALRKLQEVLPYLDGEYSAVVKRLLEDALQSDMTSPPQSSTMHYSPISEYDDYGFMIIPEYEVEHLKLLAKIQALEIRSNKLLTHDVVDKPLRMKWNNIGELSHSVELKTLVRWGIPTEHRKRVWKWLTSQRIRIGDNHYKDLLRKCECAQHPASQQIELDIHRTLTNNKNFSSPTSEFIQKLRRVLLAFSWQNPTIGYCQGLNRLAALALLVLEDEESAFYCLVDVVENIMPAEYYSNNLAGSQVDQRVFKDFLAEKLPRLSAHFEQYKIDLALITFNWLLVVFIDSLVSDILLRVWDAFLYEGTKVIFRYALAIFKYNEEEILKLTEETEIYQYLSFFTKTICDGRKLMNIAFNDMNPFPMKLVKNRRVVHMEKFKVELVELENLKREYVKSKQELRRTDNDVGVSDDDEDT